MLDKGGVVMAYEDGRSKHPLYKRWKAMRTRCNHDKSYVNVFVSKEWDNFWTWLSDMGEPPTSKHQIDRINPKGNYCKDNCRWVTPHFNSFNKSRYANNSSGIKGVYKEKSGWWVRISANKKKYTFGSYETADKALHIRNEIVLLWPDNLLMEEFIINNRVDMRVKK